MDLSSSSGVSHTGGGGAPFVTISGARRYGFASTLSGMKRLVLTLTVIAVGAASVAPAAFADAKSTPSEQQLLLASRPGIKIRVGENGWYRIERRELVAAGLSAATDTRMLQLYTDGAQIPLFLRGVSANKLAANGAVEFYGRAHRLLTADVRTYWLVTGTKPGERVEVGARTQMSSRIRARSYEYTAISRERKIFMSPLKNGVANNFFGDRIAAEPVSQRIIVRHFDRPSKQPVLTVAIQGFSKQPHAVKVTLNGADVGLMSFKDRAHAVAKFSVSRQLVKEGENIVTLASTAGETDVSFADEVRLTYGRFYRAEDDSFRFTLAAGRHARIDGFTRADVRLLDVTQPNAPRALTATARKGAGGYSITIGAAKEARRLLAVTAARVRKPVAVVAERPSSLHRAGQGADLVIISHRNFLEAIEPLRALRERQGLKVAVVDVEDVYDEFSFGAHTADALKAFLTTARDRWRPAPRFVLLVGDASFDPLNILGKGDFDFVPTKYVDTDYIETGSDGWLSDFNGDGVGDLAMGRLPVRTDAQARTVIGKIVGYDVPRPAPALDALLISDKNDGFDFEGAIEKLRTLIPGSISVETMKRSAGPTDAAVRQRVLQKLNQGPKVVNYFGHGSTTLWSPAAVLQNSDVDNLRNRESLSLYVMMTCLNGYYLDPTVSALGELLLRAENGGAIAVWASSTFIYATEQPKLNQEFFRLLYGGRNLTIGEVAAEAIKVVSDTDVRRTFTLFGDPTTRLR